MPLLEEVDIAVRNRLEQRTNRLKAKAHPPPPPKPVLQTEQVLARQSPQPDRLVAVRAAASPLFEAAGSLLDALPALARRQGLLDTALANTLHRRLVGEVASFQSICQDAQLRYEDTVIASYALCTATAHRCGSLQHLAHPRCAVACCRDRPRHAHTECTALELVVDGLGSDSINGCRRRRRRWWRGQRQRDELGRRFQQRRPRLLAGTPSAATAAPGCVHAATTVP